MSPQPPAPACPPGSHARSGAAPTGPASPIRERAAARPGPGSKLEKTKLNVKEFSKREENYQLFARIAFLCILLELLLRNTLLKKIP